MISRSPQSLVEAMPQKQQAYAREAVVIKGGIGSCDAAPIGSSIAFRNLPIIGGAKVADGTRIQIVMVNGKRMAMVPNTDINSLDGSGGGTTILEGAPTGTVSGSVALHSISDPAVHSGFISNVQGPQFLLLDGTRQMAGDLSLGGHNITNVVLVDGIDLQGADPFPQYLTQPEGDALYVPLGRTLTGGVGINTIGDLSANRTISMNYGIGLANYSGQVGVGTPSTVGKGTSNSVTGSTHFHAVTTTVTGAVDTIVATDGQGASQLSRIGLGGVAPDYPLHIQSTSTQARMAYDASNYVDFIVNGGGSLSIASTGDITLAPGGKDVLPNLNYTINLGSQLKQFLTIYAAELEVQTLVAKDVVSTIGGDIMVTPTTELTRDLSASGGGSYLTISPRGSATVDVMGTGSTVYNTITQRGSYNNANGTSGGGYSTLTQRGTATFVSGTGSTPTVTQRGTTTTNTGTGGSGYNTITQRGSETSVFLNNVTSAAVNKPTGVVSGDVLIVFITWDGGSLGGLTITPPSGWTQITTAASTNYVATRAYYKVAGGSEPSSYTWTQSTTDEAWVSCTAWYNVDTTGSPADVSNAQANNSTTANITAPTLTPTTTAGMSLWAGSILEDDWASNGGTITVPSGYTSLGNHGQQWTALAVASKLLSSSSATGTVVGTASPSVNNSAAHVILKPTTTSSNTSVAVNKPTGVTTNDLMLATVSYVGTPTVTAPAGWTLVLTQAGTNGGMKIYRRVAGGSEGSTYTWSLDTTGAMSIAISAYYNVDTTPTLVSASQANNSASTSMTAPTVTPTTSTDMLVFCGAVLDTSGGSTTGTAPSGMTEDADTGTGNCSVYMADVLLASGSATGTKVATISASKASVAALVAIKPSSATTASVSATNPTGTTTNDITLAWLAWDGTSATLTPPAGWTQVGSTQTGTTGKAALYYRVFVGGDPSSNSWSIDANATLTASLISLYNENTSTPIDVTATFGVNNTASTSATNTGCTTATDTAWAVMFSAMTDTGAGSNAVTPTATWTEQLDNGSGNVRSHIQTKSIATATAVGSTSATITSSRSITAMLGIKPAGSAPGNVSATVNKPTGVVNNDILIAAVAYSGTPTLTAPAGWTNVFTRAGANGSLAVYWKLASSEGANYTWSINNTTDSLTVATGAYYNVDTSSPVDTFGSQSNASSVNITSASISTSVATDLLIYAGAAIDTTAGSTTFTPAGGFSEQSDQGTGTVRLEVADKTLSASGATGSVTGTLSSAKASAAGLVALKPSSYLSNTSASPSKPTGIVAGDVMIAAVANLTSLGPTITPPAGWTLLQSTATSVGILRIYYKVAGGSEPSSYTWSLDTINGIAATITGWVNVDNASPIDVYSGQANTSSTSMVAPSVTNTVATDVLQFFGSAMDTGAGSESATAPGTMSEQIDTGSGNIMIYAAYKGLSATGATGSFTATLSNAKANGAALVALRPASTGTNTTIYVKHNFLQPGDTVYLRARGKLEAMYVSSYASTITFGQEYSHTVVRNMDGTGANDWRQGDAVQNTGQQGSGMVQAYANESINSMWFDYVYTYDGGAFSANRATDVSYTLYSANGHMVYYGMDGGKWENIFNYVTVAEAGGTHSGALEYWNGSAWTSVVSFSSIGGANAIGSYGWTFTASSQTNWAATTVNGISAYWVRHRITAYSATTPPSNGLRRASRGKRQYGPTVAGWYRSATTNNSTGANWNALDARWAIGNLENLYDYSTTVFGAAFGNYATSWVAIDSTNGIRFMSNTTPIVSLNTSGQFSINTSNGYIGLGSPAPTTYLGASGFWVGLHSSAYKLHVGTIVSGALTQGLSWSGTELTLKMATGGITINDTGVRFAAAGKFSATSIEWYQSATRKFSIGTEVDLGSVTAAYIESTAAMTIGYRDTFGSTSSSDAIINFGTGVLAIQGFLSITTSRTITTSGWRTPIFLENGSGIEWGQSGDTLYAFFGSTTNAWYWMTTATNNTANIPVYVMSLSHSGALATAASISAGGSLSVAGYVYAADTGHTPSAYSAHFGTVNADYSPNSSNWSSSGSTLLLNSLNYSVIAFHDSGNRVDFIRVGAGVITLGYDGGFGAARIYIPGTLGEVWTNLSYNSGWANWDATPTFNPLGYKKVGDIVFLRGLFKRSSGSNTTIATLPAGYVPAKRVAFGVRMHDGTSDTTGRIDVQTNGNIDVIVGTINAAGYFSLDGLSFSTI